MARLNRDEGQSQSPLMDLTFQLRIMANVDYKNPFFTETAQGVIDAYALKRTPTSQDLELLRAALKEQGADRAKLDAATSIWKEASELQVLREMASRLKTAEEAEGAIRAFISGLKESVGASVTTGRENAIINNLKACFTASYQEDTLRPSAPSTAVINAATSAVESTQERPISNSFPAPEPSVDSGNAFVPLKGFDMGKGNNSRQTENPIEETTGGVDLAEIDRLIQEGQKAASAQTAPAKVAGTTLPQSLLAKDDASISNASLLSPLEKHPGPSSANNGIPANAWYNVPTGPSAKEPIIKQDPDLLDRPLSDRVATHEVSQKLSGFCS